MSWNIYLLPKVTNVVEYLAIPLNYLLCHEMPSIVTSYFRYVTCV